MFSGFGLKPPVLVFSLTALLIKQFTELHGEEKREEGDRGDQDERRWNQKRREQASQ